MTEVDGQEIARHNSRESCWVVIHDKVWDVTDFVSEHPGGARVILKCAGADASEAYDEIHDPSLVEEILPSKSCLGTMKKGSLAPPTPKEKQGQAVAASEFPPLTQMVSLDDFEKVAEKYLTPAGLAYYSSGADDEFSISDARRLYRRIAFRPRIMRHVAPVSLKTKILGCESSMPVYFSPTGMAKFAHKEAEPLIAATAGQEGVIYCMPTAPSSSHEAVFAARASPEQALFFQLYTGRDKEKCKALIQKAEGLGAKAIFLTVDTPVLGKRERDDRLKAADGDDTISEDAGGLAKVSSSGLLNPLLSWDDLDWMRQATKLPLVLKGVQTVEDAILAHAHGVDGIVLSNHGGRNQDTAQASILTLLEIRRYAPQLLASPIKEKFQVFIDGGIRRGTDVIKALALGATAVGIGRPVLYAMCADYGSKGLQRMIRILKSEIAANMALAGATSVDELVPEMINSERAEVEVSRRVKL